MGAAGAAERQHSAPALDQRRALSSLVEQAKSDGALSRELPTDYIVTAIYARSCDPTLDYMQRGNSYSGEEIVRHMLHAFFVGVSAITPTVS